VLGDLVEDERFKRCGASCDLQASAGSLTGWSAADVIDGYAAACKVKVPAAKATSFAKELESIYKVRGAEPACAVATSSMRGASIPEALATMARIREEAKRRDSAAALTARREAERLAAMQKQKADNAAAMAKAEAEEFRRSMLDASIQRTLAALDPQLVRRRHGVTHVAPAVGGVDRKGHEGPSPGGSVSEVGRLSPVLAV
jgi:hypothetical protein